jgi:peroxiredoxin
MKFDYINTSSPFMSGDIAPAFIGIDQHGRESILWGMAGTPVVIFFFPKLSISGCEQILSDYATLHEKFAAAGAEIIAIGLENPQASRNYAISHNIPYPMLPAEHLTGNHPAMQILKHYNVLLPAGKGEYAVNSFSVIIDENSRIRKICTITNHLSHAGEVLQNLQTILPVRQSREVSMQAPVLLIDNVLTQEECDHLIHVWHTQGNVDSGSMKTINGKTVGVYDYDRKIRRDHFIKDSSLLTHLDITMRRRVFPQISKAFHFDCTRREDYKIACYDAERKGYFRKHRDNTTAATAHRVWAMSLNLNSDQYEGGHLRFPEFSNDLYKPKTGSALIFSGSMMHEATDVINGKRFVLLQFFYGEKEAEIRKSNRHLLIENNVTSIEER